MVVTNGIRIAVGMVALVLASGPSAVAGQDDARSRLVISVDQLAGSLDDSNVVLLHVGDRAEYDAEHIRGARYIDLASISAPRPASPSEGLILELPEPAVLRERLQDLGVSDDSRIVVYYGNDWITPATRVVLTLQWAGFGDRTRLLDGGMLSWKAAGRPVTADMPQPRQGRVSPLKTRDVVVTASQVKDRLGQAGVSIVDARAPRFYQGQYESQGERPGHIAGAKSIPFTDVVDDALKFRNMDELRTLFRNAGVGDSDTIIAYCHIGQQATAIVFAARLLGHPVVLYDGSYTEWGRSADLPIEKPGGGQETGAAHGTGR